MVVFLSALVLCVCLSICYFFNLNRFERRIEMAQNVLYGAAQFIAETLSKIFFEQSTMYEAVLNDAEIYVNWKMSEIKTKYPNVVKATIEQFDTEKIASMPNYLISFENEDIKLIFKNLRRRKF